MKLGITRWKMVLSKSGTPLVSFPVAGFVHSLVPLASPIKFATVFGACLGKSVHFNFPSEVSKMASGSAAGFSAGFAAAPATVGFALVAVDFCVVVAGFFAVVAGFVFVVVSPVWAKAPIDDASN